MYGSVAKGSDPPYPTMVWSFLRPSPWYGPSCWGFGGGVGEQKVLFPFFEQQKVLFLSFEEQEMLLLTFKKQQVLFLIVEQQKVLSRCYL